MKRFYVQREIGETDCECPPALCPHGDAGMDYVFWVVVDREDDEDRQPPDFDVFADARRYCDRQNAAHEADHPRREARAGSIVPGNAH